MQPLQFPKLTRENVHAENILIGQSRLIRFPLGTDTYVLRFLDSFPGFEPSLRVELRYGDQLVTVDLETPIDLGQLSPKLKGVRIDDLAPDLQPTALEVALEGILNAAEQILRSKLEVLSIGSNPRTEIPDAKSFAFAVGPGDAPSLIRGQIWADQTLTRRLSEFVAKVPSTVFREFNQLPMRARVRIGETALPHRDFENLAAGDVVLLDRHYASEPGFCEVAFAPDFRFNARLEGRQLTLLKMSTDAPSAKPQTPAAAPATTPAGATNTAATTQANLGSLPVHLVFQVGDKQLRLDGLRQIQPGYVFELDQPAARPITVVANDLPIGTGEIVQIGDRLGIRLLDWTSQEASAKVMEKK